MTTFAQGKRLIRIPSIVYGQNSQTMSLLEGHLNINPTKIALGELALADDTALLPTSTTIDGSLPDLGLSGNNQISTYVVRDGDTLSSIAKMFGVSINTIIWANDLSGARISPGQMLVILPISGVQHVVKKGDTVQSIAKKYEADLGDILAYNGITADQKLNPGEEILVPDGEVHTIASTSLRPSSFGVETSTGYYLHPLRGGRKTQGLHGHNGLDFGGPVGSPILAAADGAVIVARTSGYNGGYGLYVVISHNNGTQTLYAHLSQVNVSVGTQVVKGEVIGQLGNSGRSTGPHLHFEVRGARNPF